MSQPADRLDGQVALVTGGGRGIGAGIARELADAGAKVAVAARSKDQVEEVAREIGGLAVELDVTDLGALRAMADEVETAVAATNAVVASAGVAQPRCDASELDLATWQHVLAVNMTGVFLTAQVAIPQLRRRGGGAIVVVSSVGGLRGSAGYSAYVASKHGVIGLMRSLANELAVDGIRVNAVSGGVVETEALDHFPNKDEMIKMGTERTPAGRLVQPDDIANAVIWLCSPGAEMVRGQTLVVDGGFSLLAQ